MLNNSENSNSSNDSKDLKNSNNRSRVERLEKICLNLGFGIFFFGFGNALIKDVGENPMGYIFEVYGTCSSILAGIGLKRYICERYKK